MILGCLGGLVIGCFIGMFNLWRWHLIGTKSIFKAYAHPYRDALLIVLGSAVFGTLVGIIARW